MSAIVERMRRISDFLRGCLLALSIAAVFAIVPGRVPLGLWLGAVGVVSLVGGVTLGRTAIILLPIIAVTVLIRAELVSKHPIGAEAFIYDCAGLAVAQCHWTCWTSGSPTSSSHEGSSVSAGVRGTKRREQTNARRLNTLPHGGGLRLIPSR